MKHQLKGLMLAASAVAVVSCDAGVTINTPGQTDLEVDQLAGEGAGTVVVATVTPAMALPGETVQLTGEGFTAGMEIVLMDTAGQQSTVSLSVASDTAASFDIPEGTVSVMTMIAIQTTETVETIGSRAALTITRLPSDYPIMLVDKTSVCEGIKFYNAKGELTSGTGVCNRENSEPASSPAQPQARASIETTTPDSTVTTTPDYSVSEAIDANLILAGQTVGGVAGQLAPCDTDGAVGCLASASFPAVDKSRVATAVLQNQTFAGIDGTVTPTSLPPACSVSQLTDCITSADFPAANPADFTGAQLLQGETIAGVAGTLESCTAANQTDCLTTSDYPSLALAGAPAGLGLTAANFASSLPNPGNLLFWNSQGVLQTATGDADLLASNLRTGQTYLGVNGTVTPSPGDCSGATTQNCVATGSTFAATACSAEGEQDCFVDGTSSSLDAADTSVITASILRRGQTVAGVTGAFPSAAHPLPRYQTDGTGTAEVAITGAAELNTTDLLTRIKSDDPFEFHTSSGQLLTAEGDADLTAANISTGVTIFDENGSNTVISVCSHTVEGTCNADALCTWQAGSCGIDPFHIRSGITILGRTGTMKLSCRSAIDDTVWNVPTPGGTNAPSTGGTLDVWDTVDLVTVVGAPLTPSIGTWGADNVCGPELWSDLTADGACDTAGDDCLMKDNVSGLIWSESEPTPGVAADDSNASYASSVSACDSLNYGGIDEWRLPTQIELMQAHNHGIGYVGYNSSNGVARPGGDTLRNNDMFLYNVWHQYNSATKSSSTSTENFQVNLFNGESRAEDENDGEYYVCVYP